MKIASYCSYSAQFRYSEDIGLEGGYMKVKQIYPSGN